MKWWGSALVAAFVPGGLLLVGARWLIQWARRRAAQRDLARLTALIKPPRNLFEGHDESLRYRTEARRTAADGIRRRAAKVESGSPVADVLQHIKRRA